MTYPSNTPTDYATLWQGELKELNDPNVSAAVKLETFFTYGLGILEGFYEQQMGSAADLMTTLSQLETDTSEMQADFDKGDDASEKIAADQKAIQNDADQYAATGQQSYLDDMNAKEADMAKQMTDYQTYVKDAMDKANDMETIVDSNPALASIKEDVDAQISVLLPSGTNSQDQTAVTNNTNDWIETWTEANSNPSQDSSTSGDNMTACNNAFNSLSTDFSGVSSETQSELQFYEGEDQQGQGLQEDCMQEWVKGINVMQTNELSR